MAEVDVPVAALLAKRTFWEKATILHAEYFRAHDKALPDRYSRYYYDVAMMAKGPIKAEKGTSGGGGYAGNAPAALFR